MDVQQALDELLQDVERLQEGSKRQRALARRREAQVQAIREALAEGTRLLAEAERRGMKLEKELELSRARTSILWNLLVVHRLEPPDDHLDHPLVYVETYYYMAELVSELRIERGVMATPWREAWDYHSRQELYQSLLFTALLERGLNELKA